jgi:hypothetical protein
MERHCSVIALAPTAGRPVAGAGEEKKQADAL